MKFYRLIKPIMIDGTRFFRPVSHLAVIPPDDQMIYFIGGDILSADKSMINEHFVEMNATDYKFECDCWNKNIRTELATEIWDRYDAIIRDNLVSRGIIRA